MIKSSLIFNDLSIVAADSNETARCWFTDTLEAIATLIEQKVCTTVLQATQNIYDILLTDDYGFEEWLGELDYHDDLRLLAQQLTTQTPVHSGLSQTENEGFCSSEFHLKDSPQQCDALGVALITDGISVSLPSQSIWDETFIEIEQVLYNELDNELIFDKKIQYRVRSVSKREHVDPVVRDWRRGIGEKIKNTDELLERWKFAFPHLDLCIEYDDKFLKNLKGETFSSVLRRLRELDDSCHIWKKTQKKIIYSFHARSESTGTMGRKDLAQMRSATCPTNGTQRFEMHGNIQPTGYRIYWFEDNQRQRLTICYAGPHLETSKFKKQ